MSAFRFLFLLSLLFLADQGAAQGIAAHSGHHYSWLEGALIGHDFGRNPWSAGGRDTEGFASARGKATLRQALVRAVEAGEERMSFDFGFDFRSIVLAGEDGTLRLDPFVLEAIEVFLAEVDSSRARARPMGQSFSVDVVLTDFRLADGQRLDVGGETPAFILDPASRRQLLEALSPALSRLGQHPLVTLNLMNEPEFLAFPAARAIQRIRQGVWREVYYVQGRPGAAAKVVAQGQEVVPLLEALGEEGHVRVHLDPRRGAAKLWATPARVEEVDQFLIELRAAIAAVAPQARTTIGWADDQSAIENTLRLERQAGHPLTEVVSFHVYAVPINPWHPLATRRADFAKVGLGDRQIRITEWGLGRLRDQDSIRAAIVDVFSQVRAAGFDGVLFWWDPDHAFDQTAYRQALASALPTAVEMGPAGAAIARPALGPAYPNPFNACVRLPYQVSAAGPVRLRVYDLAGQIVSELVDQWEETGAHEVVWDGRREATGVYVYELKTGSFKAYRQMALIK